MGRFFHILKPNKTREFPRNWIFVDTETTEKTVAKGVHRQSLRLGVATYVRDSRENHPGRESTLTFTKVGQFWRWALASGESDRTMVLLAYNAGFDVRILDTFKRLTKRGYVLKKLYTGQNVFIAMWHNGKRKIIFLDMMNYLDGKLEKWGDMLGVQKVKVNFKRVSHKRLAERCRVDVDILRAAWDKWREFVIDNDLGHFTPTRASQALSAYVHRYMKHSLFIHADGEALGLERDSYFGGRTECFFVGKLPGKYYYKVDVNSMYPAIMATEPLPRRLVKVYTGLSIAELRRAVKKYVCVAEVTVKTRVPAYPYRTAETVMFPVGTFDAVLCGAELRLALEYGHIRSLRRVAVYRKAVLFRGYVSELYALRKRYKADGNKVFDKCCKYLLNSLYGKWAQHSHEWKDLGYQPGSIDGVRMQAYEDEDDIRTHRTICSHEWVELDRQESIHSFPAISACITAAARVRLWKLMVKAGRSNVFYVDTDSLIVNTVGYRRLRPCLHPTKLGKLKLEYRTKELELLSPKDYKTNKETKVKGVPERATQIGDNKFRYWQWEGMKGALRQAHHAGVYMYKREKVLTRRYLKGQVSTSGVVSPTTVADA